MANDIALKVRASQRKTKQFEVGIGVYKLLKTSALSICTSAHSVKNRNTTWNTVNMGRK